MSAGGLTARFGEKSAQKILHKKAFPVLLKINQKI
jgi:hypothetical protein